MITAVQNVLPTSTLQTIPVIASQDSFSVSRGAGAVKMFDIVIFCLETFLWRTVLPVNARFASGDVLELSEPGLAKRCGLCSISFHVVYVAQTQRDTCALENPCDSARILKIFWRREHHAGCASWPTVDAPGRYASAAGASNPCASFSDTLPAPSRAVGRRG